MEFMSDDNILDEIAMEGGGEFSGDDKFAEAPRKSAYVPLPVYKVWNQNPKAPDVAIDGKLPKANKIIIINKGKNEEGKTINVSEEVVDKVRAVILFQSSGRELGGGAGKNFRTKCQSHDGVRPSLRIDDPYCHKASASDLVKVISKWKGMDTAKIDVKVQELTEGSEQLQFCGLKTKDGVIGLCPFSRKNDDLLWPGGCKQHVYVRAYDIERKREFEMKLTGRSIDNNAKYTAPFYEFFKFLRTNFKRDGKSIPMPCYAFSLDLSSTANGEFFILDVKNWKPIVSPENRAEMKAKAEMTKEWYDKEALRLSKEAFEKTKAVNKPTTLEGIKQEVAVHAEKAMEAFHNNPPPMSFEDDDINF